MSSYDSWINEMLKAAGKESTKDDNKPMELSEKDLDKIADKVITKLSSVSAPKSDKETEDIETENEDEEKEKENEK